MKGNRQLNHPLDMQTEMPARGLVAGHSARYRAPDVFENFMSVEEVGAVEQIEAPVELLVVGWHGH
jgi:hypothetical protein